MPCPNGCPSPRTLILAEHRWVDAIADVRTSVDLDRADITDVNEMVLAAACRDHRRVREIGEQLIIRQRLAIALEHRAAEMFAAIARRIFIPGPPRIA
jgi:hypothetical protein